MDNDILNIARNLVVDLRRAGDTANAVPAVQGSFYSLSASLDIVLAEIIRTKTQQFLDGVNPKQEQINLILKLTGREQEDLSWWAVFDRKEVCSDYNSYRTTEDFDTLSKRAEQLNDYIVNENSITRRFVLETKWWKHEVTLSYSRSGYFSVSNNKHQFLGEDLVTSSTFVKRSYYEDFIRDLKMKSLYDDYAGSSVMKEYVEQYTIRNTKFSFVNSRYKELHMYKEDFL